ncbi:MAG: MucR family transcriptional regulator [Thermobifida sp.]|nr:MucR family transcriptional regulator [Thermobifida sp.]
MRQDVDGVMTTAEARESGYLPTAEVPALIGVERVERELGRTMRREGLRPVRVGHAYWWNAAAVEEWAAQRRWIRPQGSAAAPCSSPDCNRDAISHGLCLKHYKRARGKHADEAAPRVGQPVGAGVYGRITEDEEGRLICHECGGAYLSLAAHAYLAHGMTAAEYRETYELPRTTKLAAPSVRERISRSSSKPEALARLARVRDPRAAADARTDETFRAVSRTQRSRHASLPK